MTDDARSISVIHGDIANQPNVDAVVNSANRNMRLGSGVSGAIHTAAGHELEEYCAQFRPLLPGTAVLTPGFGLPNKWIIHVRAPHYRDDENPEQLLANTMVAALRKADEVCCCSIAVPALSTGKFMFPMEEASKILSWALLKYLRQGNSSLKRINIVLPTIQAKTVFEDALNFITSTTKI